MLSKNRYGSFTGSSGWKLFVGGNGVTRSGYILEKATERILGESLESFSSKDTEHGEENEYEAIQVFKQVTGLNVGYLDQKYFPIDENSGSTPDGAVVDFNDIIVASLDVKCPTKHFFTQKLMLLNDSKPEFQNSPRSMFYQGQWQMASLTEHNRLLGHPPVKEHYLFRYLTKPDYMKVSPSEEYNLSLSDRWYYKKILWDDMVQEQIKIQVAKAVKERDELIIKLKTPLNKL